MNDIARGDEPPITMRSDILFSAILSDSDTNSEEDDNDRGVFR